MTPTPSNRKKALKDIEKQKAVKIEKEICDNCALGHWVTDKQWNYDIYGKPLTIRCPYREFGINRGTEACINFKKKN